METAIENPIISNRIDDSRQFSKQFLIFQSYQGSQLDNFLNPKRNSYLFNCFKYHRHALSKMGTAIMISNHSLNECPESYTCLYDQMITDNLINKTEVISYNISEQVLDGYLVDNREQIISFIESNIDIIKVLDEAEYYAGMYYDNYRLLLAVHEDSYTGEPHLNILILNNLPFSDALSKEDRLFKDWFIQYFKQYNGKINIRSEYSDEF